MEPLTKESHPKTNASSGSFFTNCKTTWVNCNALGAIISFVDPNKSISQFKHIVSKAAGGIKDNIKNSVSKHVSNH